MKKIRLVTLFSGYDSQALALERLKHDRGGQFDYELVAWCEIEDAAIKAHNALFPQWSDRNLGDICKLDPNDVPDCDLLTYSFPCQDISSAGKQRGFEQGSGSRSSLLWECEKIIKAKRPKYLLMENVKALVQKKFMPEFQRWIDTLADLGYSNCWEVLNAKDYGVAQNRERVFAVSILRTADNPNPAYNFPEPLPLTKCVEDYVEPDEEIGEEYFINQERKTDKVLSDIFDQPNVRAEMEKLYHEEWKESDSNQSL